MNSNPEIDIYVDRNAALRLFEEFPLCNFAIFAKIGIVKGFNDAEISPIGVCPIGLVPRSASSNVYSDWSMLGSEFVTPFLKFKSSDSVDMVLMDRNAEVWGEWPLSKIADTDIEIISELLSQR